MSTSSSSNMDVFSTPSRIRYVYQDFVDENGNHRRRRRRQGHLISLNGCTRRSSEGTIVVELVDNFHSMHVASFLAWKHVQDRNAAVIRSLPDRLGACDLEWTYEGFDTQFSPMQAARAFVYATTRIQPKTTTTTPTTTSSSSSSTANSTEFLPLLGNTTTTTNSSSSSPTTTTATVNSLPQRTAPPRPTDPPRTAVPLPRDTDPPFVARHTAMNYDAFDQGRRRHRHRRQLDHNSNNNNNNNDNNNNNNTNNDDWQFPFAISGATYSGVTMPISILGSSAYELPQTSGSATSAALDAQPLFSRTIPTNAGDAQAIMLYFQQLGVTHMACLYLKDPWGNFYNADLQRQAALHNIQLASFSYDENDILSSIERLQQSGRRYIVAIMFDWKAVLEVAYDAGIIGNPEYVWVGAEMVDWTSPGLQFSRSNPRDMKLAHALHGTATLMLHVDHSPRLEQAMKDFATNTTLQQEYIAGHAAYDPVLATFLTTNYTFGMPDLNYYQYFFYDATYSLALAACETPGLFTGPEFYETLVNLEFDGVTGHVQFDNVTGTRKPETVTYRMDNIYWSDTRSDADYIRFDSQLAVLIQNGRVQDNHTWQYYDNSTVPPPAIPPMDHNYNLIPFWAQLLGWFLGGFVVVLSLSAIVWTWYNRKRYIVRASQPIFLCQLCCGTCIMGLAVIPMSLQGETTSRQLDIACMATPWLVFLGFVIAFSALFSKTWRLNKLLGSGMGLRRIEVKPVDVIWPFVVLTTLNVTLLLGWSLVAPQRYMRIDEIDIDKYGRSVASYGRCQSDQGRKNMYFLIPLLVLDFIGVATASYQSYRARHLPTELSESSYLAISMASLLETLFLGGPIFFMVLDNPTAFFVVGSALLCICCMTILLPVFVPKYKYREEAGPRGRNAESVLATVSRNRETNMRASLERVQHGSFTRGKLRIKKRGGRSRTSGGSGNPSTTGTNRYGDSTNQNYSYDAGRSSGNRTSQSGRGSGVDGGGGAANLQMTSSGDGTSRSDGAGGGRPVVLPEPGVADAGPQESISSFHGDGDDSSQYEGLE